MHGANGPHFEHAVPSKTKIKGGFKYLVKEIFVVEGNDLAAELRGQAMEQLGLIVTLPVGVMDAEKRPHSILYGHRNLRGANKTSTRSSKSEFVQVQVRVRVGL